MAIMELLILPVVLAQSRQAPQPDQIAIARETLSADRQVRNRAVRAAAAIAPANVNQTLRTALITLLAQQNETVQEAIGRGITLDTLEDPEFISAVARIVAGLNDDQAIPVLAGALGMGNVNRALADFGEKAVPFVVDVVTSKSAHYSAVDDGLRVLRLIVEGKRPRPLSGSTMAAIRQAAQQRLTGEQYFTTVWNAIDLAIALNDPKLREIVQSLASDPNEIVARGITDINDLRLIEMTQKRAAERLAGVPAMPRP